MGSTARYSCASPPRSMFAHWSGDASQRISTGVRPCRDNTPLSTIQTFLLHNCRKPSVCLLAVLPVSVFPRSSLCSLRKSKLCKFFWQFCSWNNSGKDYHFLSQHSSCSHALSLPLPPRRSLAQSNRCFPPHYNDLSILRGHSNRRRVLLYQRGSDTELPPQLGRRDRKLIGSSYHLLRRQRHWSVTSSLAVSFLSFFFLCLRCFY